MHITSKVIFKNYSKLFLTKGRCQQKLSNMPRPSQANIKLFYLKAFPYFAKCKYRKLPSFPRFFWSTLYLFNIVIKNKRFLKRIKN